MQVSPEGDWSSRVPAAGRGNLVAESPFFLPPQASCLCPASSRKRREGVGSPEAAQHTGRSPAMSNASKVPGPLAALGSDTGSAQAPSASCRSQLHLGCASAAVGGFPPNSSLCFPEPSLGKWLPRNRSLGEATTLERDPTETGFCFRTLPTYPGSRRK